MSADRVRAVLGPKRSLLVLDNCEHAAEAAARTRNAAQAASLHVLATSSEPLAVEGEHIYRVPPVYARRWAPNEASRCGGTAQFAFSLRGHSAAFP